MSEFEKWYKEKYYKYDLYPKYAQFRKEIKETWQAATAERDKLVTELQATNSELSASINVLREALEWALECVDVGGWIESGDMKPAVDAYRKASAVLASTPAQHINNDVLFFTKDSLQAHDNEVIERCAKVAMDWDITGIAIADAIRSLKGK